MAGLLFQALFGQALAGCFFTLAAVEVIQVGQQCK